MDSHTENPTCISIILCEKIYRDEQTKNLIIVGTFNTIGFSEFPNTYHQMSVLFTLTGARGERELSLSIEHARTGQRLIELKGPVRFDNPLAIVDINIALHGVVFHDPGKHWIVLRVGEEIINQRPFTVYKKGGDENADDI